MSRKPRPLPVRVEHDVIRIGRHFTVSFQRTLRIPDDGRTYPLPPSLGQFPLRRVADYANRVPASWRARGGVFIPMYQREALWMSFSGAHWRPTAVKIAIGKVNAVSGHPWSEALAGGTEPGGAQDYLVCPNQPWLDGINAGDGFIRQFVAMPLGSGYTVEAQVTGAEEHGGIQIMAFDPKPGRFPSREPRVRRNRNGSHVMFSDCHDSCLSSEMEMGLGAGGRMTQEIYPDPHGIDTWDLARTGRVFVHIVNSAVYHDITGEAPPPTPVSARTYAQFGLPWFDLYGEGKGDVAASGILAGVKSVKDKDHELDGGPLQDDEPVEIPDRTVTAIGGSGVVADGEW